MKVLVCENAQSISDKALENAIKLLPIQRREHVLLYKNKSDIINGVTSFLLLKKLLSDCYGFFEEISFTYGTAGKPYLKENGGLFFSLSHCKTACAAAVHTSEIGLDVLDKRKINLNIANKICCENELLLLEKSDDKENLLREMLCRKEGFSKMTGNGFTAGFSSIDTVKEKTGVLVKTADYVLCTVCNEDIKPEILKISAESLFFQIRG